MKALRIAVVSVSCVLVSNCSQLDRDAKFTQVSDMKSGLTLQFRGKKPGWMSIRAQDTPSGESGSRIENGWSTKACGSGLIHYDIAENSVALWPNPALSERIELLKASEVSLDETNIQIGRLEHENETLPIVISLVSE